MMKKKPIAPARGSAAQYREMSAPHPTRAAADAAVAAFRADVEDAREKHRIADVFVVVGTRARTNDQESDWMTAFQMGDALRAATLLAQAHGQAQERIREMLAEAVTRGRQLQRGF